MVSDTPAGERKIGNLFLQCLRELKRGRSSSSSLSGCVPDPVHVVLEPISKTAKRHYHLFLFLFQGRKVTKMHVLCKVFLLCQMVAIGPEKYVEATNTEAEFMNHYNHVEVSGYNLESSQT